MKTIKLPRNTGLIFEALPADRRVLVRVEDNGRPNYVWPNRLALPPKVLKSATAKAMRFLYPPKEPISFEHVPWMINLCADADDYGYAMAALSKTFTDTPIFNHPDGILRTRRDRAAALLEGIEALEIPTCVRFRPKTLSDFEETFQKNSFTYPVLVRPERSQTGKDLVKINTPIEWRQLEGMRWSDRAFYMTQYVEFSDVTSEGTRAYFKLRILVCGDTFFVRQALMSDKWMVHVSTSSRDRSASEDEWARMQMLRNHPKVEEIARVAREQFSLDVFGIDLGYLPNEDRFVFFEATAAISIYETTKATQGHLYPALFDYRVKGEQEIAKLLRTPEKWRAARTQAVG
ncbi:hypothetical protein HKCCSP123_05180 [Rhodobacterales bacterium HKCCSP123]|nr:hypothetical protein [Rhodobacterales bacterium HKCCSP123]